VRDLVASLHRGPLGRLGIDGDEGDVVGKAVSVGRGDARSTRFEAGHGMGEELTGTTGTLAMRLIGVSGMGGEGVRAGDEGAGWARWTRTDLRGGASCMGLGKGLGLGTPRRAFGKRRAHCLYNTA